MKNWIGVLLILATIVVPGIVAKALAQTSGINSVTITSTEGGDSQAAVSGGYTVASGYIFSSITVNVQPTGGGGGEGGSGVASTNGNANFSAAIQVPPDATYDIQVYLTVKDGSGNPYYIYSNAATGVYVPNGPP